MLQRTQDQKPRLSDTVKRIMNHGRVSWWRRLLRWLSSGGGAFGWSR